MSWVKYTNVNKRREERLTITRSGAIGFPSQFYKDNQVVNFKFTVLYFDEEQKKIALQFTSDENEKDKISIIHSKAGDGGYILARNFFKTYKIDPNMYAGRYEYEKDNDPNIGNVLILKLKEKEQSDVSAQFFP
jgi:hypothetical protein